MTTSRCMPLVKRRWFGIAVAILLMTAAKFLWISSFDDLTLSLRIQAFCTVFLGPFGWGGSPLSWLARGEFPWFPLLAAIGIGSHPIHPSVATFVLSCLGAACWWIMGWWTMASAI